MQKLKLDEYSQRLCAAKKAYNYPKVTCYDFSSFLEKKELCLYETKHQSMLEVEELIREQLLSRDIEVVKNGLSNVLYWGYAKQSGRQYDRVDIFRREVTCEQLNAFIDLLTESTYISLNDIRTIKIPQFSQMPFVSKLAMFLLPMSNPVLDNNIARFAHKQNIPPLKCLTIRTTINLSKSNMKIYDKWALWCKNMAKLTNENPSSPCKGLRAVDVERAIYCRIPNKKDKNQDTTEALLLLAGPVTE